MREYISEDGASQAFVFESVEDFNKAIEKLLTKMDGGSSAAMYSLNAHRDEFSKFVGRIWSDGQNTYKVIAFEENCGKMGWYWVLENTDDPRDIKYISDNGWEFEDGLIN